MCVPMSECHTLSLSHFALPLHKRTDTHVLEDGNV